MRLASAQAWNLKKSKQSWGQDSRLLLDISYLEVPHGLPQDGRENGPDLGLETLGALVQEVEHVANVLRLDDDKVGLQVKLAAHQLQNKGRKKKMRTSPFFPMSIRVQKPENWKISSRSFFGHEACPLCQNKKQPRRPRETPKFYLLQVWVINQNQFEK